MKIVIASGYYDPINGPGHIAYLKMSKEIATKDGLLVVIVNNDNQAILKKGKYFMKCSDRMTILRELRSVDVVVESIDTDRTVRKTIEMVYQNYKKIYGESLDMWLSNGGDVNNDENMPEKEVCDRLGIKLTEKLGEKISSSSWLTGLKARKDVEGSSIVNLSHIGI
jgi:bifunctional ADP-heptose synthase (sugar kinase/adenylyltransferase)